MAHRVHIVQQTVQGIAVLEDGSSGSHLQSKPLPSIRSRSTSLHPACLPISNVEGSACRHACCPGCAGRGIADLLSGMLVLRPML